MKKQKHGENEKVISVANLPNEFTIEDPQAYIKLMRSSFLKKVRVSKGLSRKEVSFKAGVNIEDIDRIEQGLVNEQDMMALSELCELYDIDYPSILFLFKLAKRPEQNKVEKMAAYHDQKIDEETQKELIGFLSKLKDSIE
jgi:transcriptional regulator with XRE-family HTH domain